MGLLSWLAEEAIDLIAGNSTEQTSGDQAPGVDNLGHGEVDFIDPLEAAKDRIADDPELTSIENRLDSARATYREAAEAADIKPTASSVDSTLQMIDNVRNASPEQLSRWTTQLAGMNAVDSIHQSVAGQQADLSAGKAHHQLMIDADKAKIDADSAIARADDVIAKTKSDL
ncbi:hypothetical protein APR12_001827 [Nocardia amikacinitolerans]|uniref:hypothetical protein n=1 Tax=Nocardia amikacinitolerans TaxID=756689 RepID=UPI00082AEA77|nr:hypothetical protein [Nocardia amikacinitolerans]MCP2316490.1 hypothetical protein [Nocardia amikacinitolerans]